MAVDRGGGGRWDAVRKLISGTQNDWAGCADHSVASFATNSAFLVTQNDKMRISRHSVANLKFAFGNGRPWRVLWRGSSVNARGVRPAF